jgi:hypothetical protein
MTKAASDGKTTAKAASDGKTKAASDGKTPSPAGQPSAEEGERRAGEANPAEVQVELDVTAQNVGQQVNVATQNNNYFPTAGVVPEPPPLKDLPDELRGLPPHLHSFRDPRHDQLLRELDDRRIVLLASYQENAAYAAAYSLVRDDHFSCQSKLSLCPTRKNDKERSDLDLLALAKDEFLGEKPQILLIDIVSSCTLLDSLLALASATVGTVRDRLETHDSYLVVAADEDLLANKVETAKLKRYLPYYAVSHLRYLLARHLADRAEEFERRLLAASAMELGELYQRVANLLAEGVAAFEEFLREQEEESGLPLAVRKERLQPIRPQDVFPEASEVHRAAAFVATYLPGLSQRDFERLVLVLLGDGATKVERTRQVVGNNGELTTLREEIEERWSDRWRRGADQVFRDCHLCAATAGDGTWAVDFSEPYLRRELRGHLERHFPWYVRRQCKALQDSGELFALDLSPPAVEGLVRLFVERAIVDPAGFGSVWLLDLVGSLRIQVQGSPPSGSPAESLAWLLEQVAVEVRLRTHFHERLALLIREMMDREALRAMVREFFEFLLAARQHDALLDVILGLARRLRFAPHFDPLLWMRRLLDEGSEKIRDRTADQLVALATESGPRIYEFLAVVRSWLPEEGRPSERFSASNRLALEFPFACCLKVARSLPPERFGLWPSRHPLFYALPGDPAEARNAIVSLVEWLFDPRGAALEKADRGETMRTAEVVRVGHLADLVEHWAWVLEGESSAGPAEGRALMSVIVEEIDRRISARERSWLQRSWQRRQDDYLRQAASKGTSDRPGRTVLVARRARLDQLRTRFAVLPNSAGSAGEFSEIQGGTTP